jgi:hypothetical protein
VERCGGIRRRIQEPGGDLGGVGRYDLVTDFDPVGGRLEQHRAVAVRRSTPDEIWDIR